MLSAIELFADEPLIVAHRGASFDAPENTMPAFLLAWERGADAIEGDFYLTRDGHIVCCHDKSTERYADENLVVKESTLAELQALDVGRWKHRRFADTHMPTLPDVLACVPAGKQIFVEVKCGPEIVPALLQDFANSQLDAKQIVVISFHSGVIAAVKKAAPQYQANWLSGFKKQDDGRLKPSLKTVLTTLERIDADGFSSTKDHIDEAFIAAVEQRGYPYHVWTIDDGTTANRFRKWGADSITTNRPKHIRDRLNLMSRSRLQAP